MVRFFKKNIWSDSFLKNSFKKGQNIGGKGSCSHAEANVSPSDGWRGNGGSHPSIDETGTNGSRAISFQLQTWKLTRSHNATGEAVQCTATMQDS
jgi:hypothetical protein